MGPCRIDFKHSLYCSLSFELKLKITNEPKSICLWQTAMGSYIYIERERGQYAYKTTLSCDAYASISTAYLL
ncbi:hypothetical protein Hanom_Chr01g00063751 [Helianthus anomalus]